jgi:hypothetical protein
MLKERREAAQKVADRLFAVEAAIDEALTRAAELNAAIPMARAEIKLSAVVGQDAIDRAAESFAFLVQARRHMVEAHHCLEETRIQIGLREVNVGDLAPKPERPQFARQTRHVRAVA